LQDEPQRHRAARPPDDLVPDATQSLFQVVPSWGSSPLELTPRVGAVSDVPPATEVAIRDLKPARTPIGSSLTAVSLEARIAKLLPPPRPWSVPGACTNINRTSGPTGPMESSGHAGGAQRGRPERQLSSSARTPPDATRQLTANRAGSANRFDGCMFPSTVLIGTGTTA
jgi:hypothetical protein